MGLSFFYRVVIGIGILMMVLFLLSNPSKNFATTNSDEAYYYMYAELVANKGTSGLDELVDWYASSIEARKHPAPLRFGYILLGAFLFKLVGPSFSVLVGIATVSFLLFLVVCFLYTRKYFNFDQALLGVFLLSSSPLLLGLSRRVLADVPVTLLWSLAAWLFLDVLFSGSRRRYVLFLMTLTVAMAFKEASIILLPFFLLVALLARFSGQTISLWRILGIIFWPITLIMISYACIFSYASIVGIVGAIFKTHLSRSEFSAYAIYFCSGPWFRYLLDFLLCNPIVTLLFIGFAAHGCCHWRTLDFKKKYFLAYFVYIYFVLNLLPHSKVVRFVASLEMVMALGAVFLLEEISKNYQDPRQRQVFMTYSIMAIAALNYLNFLKLFGWSGLLDPISQHLLMLHHIIHVGGT